MNVILHKYLLAIQTFFVSFNIPVLRINYSKNQPYRQTLVSICLYAVIKTSACGGPPGVNQSFFLKVESISAIFFFFGQNPIAHYPNHLKRDCK